jgi:excisionase family DNA binding protein
MEQTILFSLPKSDLQDLIIDCVNVCLKHQQQVEPEPQPKTLHSIRELADFLGCSVVTAQRYKNEGRIPYSQVGRKVIFNTAEVLKAINKK